MAKLPCIPESRIFTLKETGETMSYDQVRQYLMSNPDLWLGKGEAKGGPLSSVEATAKALEGVSMISPQKIMDAAKSINKIEYVEEQEARDIIESYTHYKLGSNKSPATRWAGWFQSANAANKKYIVEDIQNDPKLRNAMLSLFYDVYKSELDFKGSFNDFLNTEIPLYRGITIADKKGVGQEGFSAFSTTENRVMPYADEQALGRGQIKEIKIKPKDTYGAVNYIGGGEVEVLVPTDFKKETIWQDFNRLLELNIGLFSEEQRRLLESYHDKEDYISGLAFVKSVISSKPKKISEAYHAAKKDGSNQELVKAVEDLLGEKAEGKQVDSNSPEAIAARIRNKKQKGALSAIDFGISVTIYNGALEFMAAQVEKGTKLGNAIANTIKWIDDKMKGEKWNKGAFGKYMNDTYKVTLGDGREVEVVRDDSKETAEVINGWYQPIEQKLLDSKEESLPANKWAERLKSKEDEDLWTGVRAFLEEKGTERVSRKELLDFIKDNRIEIVTVVKTDKSTKEQYREDAIKRGKAVGLEVDFGGENEILISIPSQGSIKDWDVDTKTNREYTAENYEVDISVLEVANDLFNENKSKRYGDSSQAEVFNTKFSQYQLPGDKENYKEVLVTLPAKRSKVFGKISSTLDYAKDEYGINSGEYSSVKRALENELADDYGFSYAQIKELFDEYEKAPAVFRSSHFDEPNILVHLRMNTRTDADGNKVLFLEEVQSDWGQKGKKEGFKSEEAYKKADEAYGKFLDRMKSKYGKDYDEYYTKEESDEEYTLLGNRDAAENAKIPTAPFVMDTNAWVKLGLKTALQEAVRQGANKIAWTTGTQQFDRWGTEKIDWIKTNKGWTINIQEQFSGTAFEGMNVDEKALSERGITITSKEDLKAAIDRNLSREKTESERQKLTDRIWERMQKEDKGTSLPRKEGMESFYGTEENKGLIGGVAEKLFGQKVGTAEIEIGRKKSAPIESVTLNGESVKEKSAWAAYILDYNKTGKSYTIDAKKLSEILDFHKKQLNNAVYKISEVENFINSLSIGDKVVIESKSKTPTSTQSSISITPELKAQVEKGLPLFGTQLTPEQELKQAFNEWKAEYNKLGIMVDWKRLAESDIKLLKAIYNYIQKKIKAAIEAGKKYSFEDFAKEYGKKIINFEEQKNNWQALYNRAATRKGVSEERAVESAVKKAAGIKKETKDKVQKFIDKAFAIGSGEGFKKGFQKGATQGMKAGFVAGKEVGVQQGTERGFTKGATEGMKAGAIEGRTQAVDMLRNALANLSGELTPKQISAIVQRLGRLKTFSEEAKQRFIDYADKVIDDANYIAKEKKAAKIKSAVNKMSKRTNVAANDQSLYKSFAALSISHLTPADLDKYMEWGEKIKNKGLQPGDRAELTSFIEQAQERQNAIVQERSEKMKEGRMRNLRAEFDEMQAAGTLPAGITTFDQYVESQKPKKKGETLEDKIEAIQERLSEIPVGENKMIDQLRNVDLSVLNKDDLNLIDNSLYNYIDTGNLYGIGDPLVKAEYLGKVKAAIEKGLKTRRQVDREQAEKLGMANFFTTIGGEKNIDATLRGLLIQPWLGAATKVNADFLKIQTAIMAKADQLKIKQPNWNRIDLFGFLNEGEGNPELFKALKEQKLSDLKTLKERVDKNAAGYDDSGTAERQEYNYNALKGAIESLGLNKNSTLESIKGGLSKNELAFYDEMRKYLDQYAPKAIENMELYGNKEVGIVKNYWPRTTNKLANRPTGIDAFDLYGSEYVGKNMFGREKGRSRLLGDAGYYTPIGQENYFNGLKETMLIADAAHEYHGMQALYNSPDKGFNQLIKGDGANDIKQLMIDWILDTKNQGRYHGGIEKVTADILNSVKKGFTTSLINNPSQLLKQPTALGYTFMEAPEPFFKAVGLVLQGMISGKDSRLAKAINGLFDTTTLGLRLTHPEMVELGEKYTIDKPIVLRTIQQYSKGINKYFGGDLIFPMDKIVSQIATVAGYIEQVERSGKKFNIFEEQAKGYDMVAAAAAEQMQAKTNNENASIYYSKGQTKTKWNRASFYLSNFQANAVRNLYINIRKIAAPRTRQEMKEGLQGVAGYLWSAALFNVAGMFTSYAATAGAFMLYQQIKNKLGDTEDDEEERERILKYLDSRQLLSAKRRLAMEVVSMLTGAYGLFARAATELILATLEQVYYKTTEEEENLSDRIFFTPEVAGYAGVVADNILAPIEKTATADNPQEEAMVQTGVLANKLLGQSAFTFYADNLLRASKLAEKEAKARKEEQNKSLQKKAFPNKKELSEAKKEWTKSIEAGEAGKARAAFNEIFELSKSTTPYTTPYLTASELRESLYKDKVKPSIISDEDEYIFRSYIFDDKNGNYMIGEKKLKELIPPSEKKEYIDEYRREVARIQKMLAVMNKAVVVKNAYGKQVDWATPSDWVKQVQIKLQKK